MRIDRTVDWEFPPEYIVADWVDLGNNVGFEMEIDCKYRGDDDDWQNEDEIMSKLHPVKSTAPVFNIFSRYEAFQEEKGKQLDDPPNSTVVNDIKKSDPIFKYGFKKRLIVQHIFEKGIIQ